tara:strand:- start:80 stop:193 length:114 start_codon:yes stop_codon:yes gene_type:complete
VKACDALLEAKHLAMLVDVDPAIIVDANNAIGHTINV